MITLRKIFKKAMGSDGETEEIIESKKQEAHDIKNDLTKDILHIKKNIDRVNLNTNRALTKISNELEKMSVTYSIGLASGGKRRGLKK